MLPFVMFYLALKPSISLSLKRFDLIIHFETESFVWKIKCPKTIWELTLIPAKVLGTQENVIRRSYNVQLREYSW